MLFFREQMVGVFVRASGTDIESAQHVIDLGARIMIFAAIFQAFDGVGIVYTGALRGAGDTFWPGMITVVLSWGLLVGFGVWIVGAYPNLGSVGPWIGATIYIIVFGGAMAWRFERGSWRTHRLTRHASVG